MTTPAARRKAAPKKRQAPAQTANKRRIEPQKGASPVNGVVPPIEHRFKPGNQAAVGHGAPRKLKEFQELILDTMAEMLGAEGGQKFTRAQAMIRLGLNKNPVPFLEYVFGKVPQVSRDLNDDEWREWLKQNGHDPDKLVAEFVAHMGDGRDSARSVPADETGTDKPA